MLAMSQQYYYYGFRSRCSGQIVTYFLGDCTSVMIAAGHRLHDLNAYLTKNAQGRVPYINTHAFMIGISPIICMLQQLSCSNDHGETVTQPGDFHQYPGRYSSARFG